MIQGLGILAIVFAVYMFALSQDLGAGEARMFAFVTLVIGDLGLIVANRSERLSILKSFRIPNKALWWVSGGALFFLVLILSIPRLRQLFQFAPVHLWEMALLFISGLASILIAESIKVKPLQKWIHREAV